MSKNTTATEQDNEQQLEGEGQVVGLSASAAGGIANNQKQQYLDSTFGGAAVTTPAVTLYVALCTGTFTAGTTDVAALQNGLTTEVTTTAWTNYSRVAVTNNATNFPASSGTTGTSATTQTSAKANGTAITFTANATVTGTGPTPTFWAILNSASLSAAANVFAVGPITSGSAPVTNGNSVSFTVGAMVLSIT